MPIVAGVRELKSRLTHYLRLVREGEEVIVTDRNRPVAVLRPIGDDAEGYDSTAGRLAAMAREGELRLGEVKHRLRGWKSVRSKGVPASRIVSDDREPR